MSDDRDPSVLLGVAHEWLDETDRIALAHFAGELTITAKHDRTLVTQADDLKSVPGHPEWRFVVVPPRRVHALGRGS